MGNLEAVVETALKDNKAGPLQPGRPHKRSSRRVPTLPELENNIFERNRLASRLGSKDENPPFGPSLSNPTSKALPTATTAAPKFKLQRRPVGFFNAPGAGQPAEAISERWRRTDPGLRANHLRSLRKGSISSCWICWLRILHRRVSHSDDGGDSRDTSTWRRQGDETAACAEHRASPGLPRFQT